MKTTDTHVYFYMGNDIYSNFWCTPNQFKDPVLNGISCDSTEQGFMLHKARFFSDGESFSAIQKAMHPSQAKALGRGVTGYNEEAWEAVRLGFMTHVNYLKYSQNPRWAKQLVDTGNRVIVEASEKDKIWGVGLYENDIRILDERQWKGRNLLGKALMHVRDMLNTNESHA